MFWFLGAIFSTKDQLDILTTIIQAIQASPEHQLPFDVIHLIQLTTNKEDMTKLDAVIREGDLVVSSSAGTEFAITFLQEIEKRKLSNIRHLVFYFPLDVFGDLLRDQPKGVKTCCIVPNSKNAVFINQSMLNISYFTFDDSLTSSGKLVNSLVPFELEEGVLDGVVDSRVDFRPNVALMTQNGKQLIGSIFSFKRIAINVTLIKKLFTAMTEIDQGRIDSKIVKQLEGYSMALQIQDSGAPTSTALEDDSSQTNLSDEQILKIKNLITKLTREKASCWPYPNKDRKQNKIDGLNYLLELAKTKLVPEAISLVEVKYPEIRAGRISTRTSDLLDSLRVTPSCSLN